MRARSFLGMALRVGDQVRSYRTRRGLTQEQLAHLIGRSERWLIDVERGEVDPRLSDAVALAEALSVGVADLTSAPEPNARPPPVRRPRPRIGAPPRLRPGQRAQPPCPRRALEQAARPAVQLHRNRARWRVAGRRRAPRPGPPCTAGVEPTEPGAARRSQRFRQVT